MNTQTLLQTAKETYLDFFNLTEPSPATFQTRKEVLDKFISFCKSDGIDLLENLTAQTILSYHKKQLELGIAASTWNKYVSGLREFFRWAGPNGQKITDSDFSGALIRRKAPGKPVEILTGKKWREITGSLNIKARRKDQGNSFQAYTNSRLHLIWHMLSVEGLRVGELVSIDLPSISFSEDAQRASVSIKGKGMHYRMVPLESTSYELLQTYLKARETYLAERGSASTHLFPSSKLSRLGKRRVQTMISSLGEKFGVNLACHKLRKTAVSRAINNSSDTPLAVVVKQFGHTVAVAEKYYLAPDEELASQAKSVA